nr:hypothetical protein [Candidatus Mycoplasma haematolamae]
MVLGINGAAVASLEGKFLTPSSSPEYWHSNNHKLDEANSPNAKSLSLELGSDRVSGIDLKEPSVHPSLSADVLKPELQNYFIDFESLGSDLSAGKLGRSLKKINRNLGKDEALQELERKKLEKYSKRAQDLAEHASSYLSAKKKVQKNLQLKSSVSDLAEGKITSSVVDLSLNAQERKALMTFYEKYSLIKEDSEVLENKINKLKGRKEALYHPELEKMRREGIIRALKDLNWSEEKVTLKKNDLFNPLEAKRDYGWGEWGDKNPFYYLFSSQDEWLKMMSFYHYSESEWRSYVHKGEQCIVTWGSLFGSLCVGNVEDYEKAVKQAKSQIELRIAEKLLSLTGNLPEVKESEASMQRGELPSWIRLALAGIVVQQR